MSRKASKISSASLPRTLERRKAFYQEFLGAAADHDAREGTGQRHLHEGKRLLCKVDLFFLMIFVLNCGFMLQHPKRQWLLDRCDEVQREPYGCIDIWAREHFKSTIITYGRCIQDMIINPEVTIGIFSWKRPIAMQFLRQIKQTLETNEELKTLFPETFWANPEKQSPKWSENDGIIIKRRGNPKEATIEAWGLIDGQPTSKHFDILHYDDMIHRDHVNNPEMMQKVTSAYQDSDNLGSENGHKRVIGTYYHSNDVHRHIVKAGQLKLREYPCRVGGEPAGDPVLMSEATLKKKLRDQGSKTFAIQMLLNAKGGDDQGFDEDWLEWYDETPDQRRLNVYIIVDPANKKTKRSDYTAMMVVGVSATKHWYLLDLLRDKLTLSQRYSNLERLVLKWSPILVGYEEYGQQSDIEHIKGEMDRNATRFRVIPLGGKLSKADRIDRLQPKFEAGEIILPRRRMYTNHEKKTIDLIDSLVEEEFKAWPVPTHDDMLDALSRIDDIPWKAPKPHRQPGGGIGTKTVSGYNHFAA